MTDALRRPGTVLLDAPRPDADSGRRGAVLYSDPVRTAVAHRTDEVGPLLDAVDAMLADGLHVAGLLSYEAGAPLVGLAGDVPEEVPLGWFGGYHAPVALSFEKVEAMLSDTPPSVGEPVFALSPAAYGDALATIKQHIREGDVYQINFTAPFRFRLDGDPLALYAALRRRQPVAYGAFVRLDGMSVVSASPELFFRVDREGVARTITARPMKGTAEPGADARDLTESVKNRAENLMIVDLLRNDIGRVTELGSVRVPALFDAERYETITQMTSTVSATLLPETTLGDTLRALFPCGSITGAPKRRAMEIIREIEGGPRGVYCGAIGHAAPNGTSVFSVAIRTAVLRDGGDGRYDVGSGIVWDSVVEDEYAECLLKARVLTDLG